MFRHIILFNEDKIINIMLKENQLGYREVELPNNFWKYFFSKFFNSTLGTLVLKYLNFPNFHLLSILEHLYFLH